MAHVQTQCNESRDIVLDAADFPFALSLDMSQKFKAREVVFSKLKTRRESSSYRCFSPSGPFVVQLVRTPPICLDSATQTNGVYPDTYREEIEATAASLELHCLGPEGLAQREAHELQVWVMGAFSYTFDQSDYYKTAYDKAKNAINRLHGITKKEMDWLEQSHGPVWR